ncbi:MAG: ribose-phosphate diphosphokinase [Halobacteriaceae archaeon]
MILPGSASQSLAAALAADCDEALGRVTYESFPDGEQVVRVPDLHGERAVVVASTASDAAHVQLLQLQDAAREAGASEVVTVIPYMGYARQDEAFQSGEPVSARAVARAVGTGADRVVVVDPHEEGVLDYFGVPATAASAASVLAAPLDGLDEPLFLSPDEGAVALARTVRDAYSRGTVDYFRKERDYDTGEVEVTPGDVDVAGRDVVVTDDIVATGSTMSEAIAALREQNPGRIVVATVHALLAGNARTKLAAAGVDRVVATDTIEGAVSCVSAAPAVADEL